MLAVLLLTEALVACMGGGDETPLPTSPPPPTSTPTPESADVAADRAVLPQLHRLRVSKEGGRGDGDGGGSELHLGGLRGDGDSEPGRRDARLRVG